ncbi:hypothetical protein NB703_004611 [Pantoea ananatis]|uniref:CAAX prenyl protease 2/Lysostaphin resistance protein A-like domain-containing protein n=1 Tax=Pantoea ananas TaxID=553 RepID=A0AAJ1D3E0_PANAN|nr:CPBP family intramembrane glutamic endopeptidase [Pantoea ananatis]MCW0346518.1 hypothetical protein [Pantoea ananatis]
MNTDIELLDNTHSQGIVKTVFAPSAKTAVLYIIFFIITLTVLNRTPDVVAKYVGPVKAYFSSYIFGLVITVLIYFTLFLKCERIKSLNKFIPLTLSLLFVQSLSPPSSGAYLTLSSLLTQGNIIYFFIMVVIGPFVEEVAFRGCLFGSLCCLCKSFNGGIIVALLMTSLVFSVMHAQYDSISAYITEFVFSVILTTIRINTKSLIYPVLAHAALNAFAVLSLIVSVVL